MSLDLKATMSLDGRGFERTLQTQTNQVERAAQNMATGLQNVFSGQAMTSIIGKGMAAVGFGAAYEFVQGLSEGIEQRMKDIKIGKARLGVDAETFQRIANVTGATGNSPEAVARAFEQIAQAIVKIREGGDAGQKMMASMRELGVSLADIDRGDFQAIFFKIAAGLREGAQSAEKLAAVKDVLGKGGTELLPAFAKGFDSADASAGIISDKDLKNLQTANKLLEDSGDVVKEMKTSAGVFAASIITGLKAIPALIGSITGLGPSLAPGGHAGEGEANERARFFQEKDRKRREAEENAELEARAKEAADAKAAQKQKEANEKEIDRVANEIAKQDRANQLASMTPEQRKQALQNEIRDASQAAQDLHKMFEANPENLNFRLNELLQQSRALNAEKELQSLLGKQDRGSREFDIQDSLARHGGGFGQTVDARAVAGIITRNIEEINRNIEKILNGEGSGF